MNLLPQNPFTRPTLWGRQNELATIYKYLLSEPPQCCAVIGETSMGKTTLLRSLSDPPGTLLLDDMDLRDTFTFVYLDCVPYIKLAEIGVYASSQFWWDLYSRLWLKLHPGEQPLLPKPDVKADVSIDDALEIKLALEGLIRDHKRTVVFVLDNFEGVAHLPLSDSDWLRSMVQFHCAYVVSSRHLLYLLYHPESWATPSPLWNLFSDPIYLGLIPEQEVQDFLLKASEQARELGSCWEQRDIAFIRFFSGRHPELIRIACTQLFEQRLGSDQSAQTEQNEFLEIGIYRAASPICDQLWRGLADPELWNVPRVGDHREKEIWALSPYQQALIDMAKGKNPTDKNILFVLKQRGLIEWTGEKWRVFAEVMRQFILKRAAATDDRGETTIWKMAEPTREEQQRSDVPPSQVAIQTTSPIQRQESLAFTHLEGKVYDYLKAHTGKVCDREDIKRAVWENNPPTDSALQKIIERIREKIELDANNPRYLIAVRGQGFMLRGDPSD